MILFFNKKINNVDSLYEWITGEFSDLIKADTSVYNSSSRLMYTNINLYTSDASSILIGYPTLRQLRVKKGDFQF